MDLDALLDRFADLVAEKLAAKASANGNGHAPEEPDRLLTADETAARLGCTRRWVYRHAGTLPFRVKMPGRAMRFSERGLGVYINKRKGG